MKNLYKKIAEVQKEMKPVIKDSTNPHFKKNYFDINAVLEEMRPIWESKGLIVIQPLTNLMGKSAITTYVIDVESGESVDTTIYLPEQTDPQKMGSAITYFRRYSLTSFFGILGEEDDDANATAKAHVTKVVQTPASAPTTQPSPVQSATGKVCEDCKNEYTPKPGTESFSTKCVPCFKASKG